MHPKRVALIVVHGVADQKPGDTATAVIELLVASAPNRTAYTALSSEDLTLAVAPLAPRNALPERDDATPRGEDRPVMKSLAQSARSDFHRERWKASGSVTTATDAAASTDESATTDRGIEASNYLLTKHRDNGAHPEAYATRRVDVERTEVPWSPTEIAVYEMYWADLSRLSGAIPRIITELFTMIFRLSKLGRGTVDAACDWRRPTPASGFGARLAALAWPLTTWLQRTLDWLFVNLLALLFAQLLLLAIVLAMLGLASTVDSETLHRTVAGGAAILGLLLLAYHRSDGGSSPAHLPWILVALGLTGLLVSGVRPWATTTLVLAVVTIAYEKSLRVADDRFPLVHAVGRSLWVGLLVIMIWDALGEITPVLAPRYPPRDALVVSSHAALFAVEVVLYVVKWLWVFVGLLLFIWIISGVVASRERGYESKASIATGRLGLCISIGTFLVMTMAIWALLSNVLNVSVNKIAYSPCIFPSRNATPQEIDEKEKAAAKAKCIERMKCADKADVVAMSSTNSCVRLPAWAGVAPAVGTAQKEPPSAQDFLSQRYKASTQAFSALAFLLLGLVVYLAGVFTPSVLAELKLLANRARKAFQKEVESQRSADPPAKDIEAADFRAAKTRRLGRWLTAGYRRLDVVVLIISAAGLLLGLAFALVFLGLHDADFIPALEAASQSLLKPLVFSAAGIATAFTLLGGVISKYIPALRAPLDVALDVDNHFREFPRTAIPRARIFSRYTALLEHVAAQGYERVVIVSHSQGTVISAELLRFLSSDGKHAPQPGARPRIDGEALPPISILTLGCPLRQLYAARFPTLYRWVIGRQEAEAGLAAVHGPRADDIGVERWFNAYCSGDYVGRWLWSIASTDDPIGHPMIDTADVKLFGRADAYSAFDPMPPLSLPFADKRQAETCLGLGAHTHYFEREQKDVAWLIDHLVAR